MSGPQDHPPLDPRLMPSAPTTTTPFKVEDAHYQRPPAPLPYPVAHSTPTQTRVYSETRPAEPSQAQPYYGLQHGRSPSDEIPDTGDSSRRESGGMLNLHNQSPNGDGQDQKRSRACEACRGLKVRCDMDANNPNEACKRCKKAGRQCIVTQPSRRRQKKSDTRVAELERKIDALTAVLASQQQQQQQQQNGVHISQPGPGPEQYPIPGYQSATPQSMADSISHHESRPSMSSATPAQTYHIHTDELPADPDSQRSNKRRRVESMSGLCGTHTSSEFSKEAADIKHTQGWQGLRHELNTIFPVKIRAIIAELVEPELMQELFDHFIANMLPPLPAIAFPAGTTADQLLQSKPFLLLAVLTVSCSCTLIVSAELKSRLYDELFGALAEAVMLKAHKSLEVLQALLVTCIWQKPAEKPPSANFYVMIHIAAVMALDLGLGKKFNPAKAKRGFGGPGSDLPPGPAQLALVDSDSIEARRAWLVCYYLSASSAQFLRRPNLLRWTNYMNQCVQVLETSPDALPSDRMLAQHIKIQHICEEINSSFALDDPEATSISILDPKVAYTLNVLEGKLRDWEAQIPDDLRKPELLFFASSTCLYLHEIALHVNHNTDDFRLPFTEASLKSGSEHGFAATLTQNQMTSIEACLKASHEAIDAFCSFDSETQVVLPPLSFFVRIVYALIVLIKLHVAVISPGSELGKIIKPADVKAADYLNKLWNVFKNITEQHRGCNHHKPQHIISILRDWVGTHQHGDSSTAKIGLTKESGAMHPPQQSRGLQDKQQQQQQQQQQQHPRSNSDDNLRVLSEAATAGANPQQPSAQWTFDGSSTPSVHPTPYSARNNSASAPSSTVVSTPQTYAGNNDAAYGGNNNVFTTQDFGMNDGLDWAAGLDFEQAVNVALQDLDFSGDLFGSFYGNGADAFQISSDVVNAGAGAQHAGGGTAGGRGGQGGGGGGGGGGPGVRW
ncbi:hypothetical protein AAFC00_006464 [Neodothiora populina]|uniref:Zn(2)-C6 fungal-type domain-containing protein n=1 Tax=Neodothiora populina TaxID=2781224 RepID=A0ABR3P6L7_9PEZI